MTMGWVVALTVVGAVLVIVLAVWLAHHVGEDNQDLPESVDKEDDE